MRVHFYDAGQALAALVVLPDGRRVLVDAGENPKRAGCGKPCQAWHERIMSGLRRDLEGRRLDLLWITHQHSDHLGGAAGVLGTFGASLYVDNGRDLEKATVKEAREAAAAAGAMIRVVDVEHPEVPFEGTEAVRFTAVVPRAWPSECRSDPNACSIGLRIDYCSSSVLFTGDSPVGEEAALEPGEVTLLQVGHHGSETSTGEAFLARTRPKYAVVSAGRIDEGTNGGYCHPRAPVIERLTHALGGPGAGSVRAFDGAVKCERGRPKPEHWVDVPSSDRLWVTARDGDVRLRTNGDGEFVRE